jgi:hypothetical protein
MVDLKARIRYKKASTKMEEASLMGFSGGFEQEKPMTALLELKALIPAKQIRVNP